MKRIKAIILLTICLLGSIRAQEAMQYSVRHYSAANGLSQNTVMSILEDADGFMWFGTWDGLNRFDGHEFRVYKPALSGSHIASNRVDYLYEDSLHFIWMKAYDGAFYRLNKHTDVIYATDIHDRRPSQLQNSSQLLLEQRPGVIWIAGGETLLRFQEKTGKNSDRMDIRRVDLTDEANCMVCDAKGVVWVGTYLGLERVDDSTRSLMLTEADVISACAHGQGVWFGTRSGAVWHTNAGGNSFDKLHLPLQSPITQITALNERELIICTAGDGFCIYDIRSAKYTIYDNRLPEIRSNNIISAFTDSRRNTWLLNEENGVLRLSADGQLKRYFSQPDNNYRNLQNYLIVFLEDRNGRVYINPYGGGFSVYDEEQDKLICQWQNVSNIIHSAFIDSHNNLWLGSYDSGIDCLNAKPERFSLTDIRGKDGESAEVRALLQLRNGTILAASKDGIIRQYSENGQLIGQQELPGRVYCMLERADGTILYGTKGDGIFVQNGKRIEHIKHNPAEPNSLNDDNVYDMVFGPDSTLYIATYGGGVNILRNGQFIHEGNLWPGYSTDFGEKVRQLCMVNDSTLWAATTNGLVRINTRTLAVSQTPYYDLRAVYRADNGHVWLGSFGGGLAEVHDPMREDVLAPGNCHVSDSHSGLASDIILSIVGDNRGDIWVNDENGLAHYDEQTKTFQRYNALALKRRGFFSEAKSILLESGNLMFGYNSGTCTFSPAQIFQSAEFPKIRFTDLLVMNERAQVGGPINDNICYQPKVRLKHRESVFTIAYSALEYALPNQVQYAYRLDGIDKDWNYVQGERRVTYSNLPAGDYIFRLKSTNGEGIWGDNEQTLSIQVTPSFWATPWAFMLYFLIIFAICYSGYSQFNTTSQLRQEVAVEQKVTDIKLRFFTNISHELRTPLTLIAGPIETVLKDDELKPGVRTQLEIVQSNAQRMLRLINQILDFRKIQNNQMKLRVQYTDVAALAKATFGNFTKEAQDKHILFRFENDMQNPMAWVDKDKTDTIIYNLLSNAFKFTPAGKSIKLRMAEKEDEYIVIEVTDTGIGIPEDKRPLLFQRFASHNEINVSDEKTGTGIGLNLVKELVDIQQGYIEVTSEVGQGSTFCVMLLRDKEHFGDDVNIIVSDEDAVQRPAEESAAEPALLDENRKSVLVVDDNHDMRAFLQSILMNEYTVWQAKNGEEAFRIAKQHRLDIVVTDLMMPNVDGLELTENLKTDMSTSHIPVILLTAKSAIESRLKALEYGADDYITKPFSPEYLLARIDNIIRQRQRLQETYRASILQPEKKSEPEKIEQKPLSPNELFLQKLYQFMVDNMDNNDLSVDDLVKEMALGRTVFFNKLKGLTGLSPVEYIRDVRIKRAAELLLDGRYNITEVTYMVGMNDSRYFAKCFKNAYGVTPTDYKKQHEQHS